jgi:hypothetical protein
MNKSNPVSSVPLPIAIVVGGLGVIIGMTQPLWVAILYVIVVTALAFVVVKLREKPKS